MFFYNIKNQTKNGAHNEKNKLIKNKKMNKVKKECEQLVNGKIVFSVIHKVIHNIHR